MGARYTDTSIPYLPIFLHFHIWVSRRWFCISYLVLGFLSLHFEPFRLRFRSPKQSVRLRFEVGGVEAESSFEICLTEFFHTS